MFLNEDNDLTHQILWAALRHEIFLAITNQDATYLDDIDEGILLSIKSPSEDSQWTSQLLYQLVRVAKYCLNQINGLETFDQMVIDLNNWADSRPAFLLPVFYERKQEGDILPEVHFLSDSAAVAAQYYHIVRIMLQIHNPRMPRLGVAKKKATKHLNVSSRYLKVGI
jgi:hypothetical protein